MPNSDPDSDSGHQNGIPPEDTGHHPVENGLPQGAYGGARPKTRTGGGRSAGSGRSRHKCRDWEEDRNRSSPTSFRRRRKVHRTNSSDSVFMIPATDKHKSKRGNALLTERNSYEDWTENQNNMDTSDPDLQLYNSRVTERVPPLPDNLVGSMEGKVVNASNSSLSLTEYRSEDPSDLDNLDILEDDCYIYTYRGGTAYLSADLPNSFFRLDSGSDGESLPGVSGAGQSNLSTGVAALLQDQLMSGQNRSSSPEEPDFLELDFDPGSDKSDLSSEDSGQGGDDEDIVQNSVSETGSPPQQPPVRLPDRTLYHADQRDSSASTSYHQPPQDSSVSPRRSESRQPSESSGRDDRASVSPDFVSLQPSTVVASAPELVTRPVLGHDLTSPAVNNNEELAADRYCNSCDKPKKEDPPSDSVGGDRNQQAGVTARSVPLVSPVTDSPVNCMPRSKSLNNSLSCQLVDHTTQDENVLLCGNRLLLREALLFGRGTVDIHEAVSRLTLNNSSHAMEAPRSMIWSHKDACRKHVTQLSGTNSSLAAICNALTALNINVSEQELTKSVKIRSKQEKAGICEYLLSCSEAGFNHADLISEIKNICGDRIVARFFPMHNRLFNLNEWLADWISRGCVPVATLNVQRGEAMPNYCPSDAWANRMIWGVTGRDIFLTNPLEVLTDSCLVPQLDSASELLIRREEIVQRFTENTDLRCLLSSKRGFNHRWREMNVLGQVVNVLRENTLLCAQELDATSITASVRIPGLFMSGVTIFCDSLDAETAALLLATAELPTRLHTQEDARHC